MLSTERGKKYGNKPANAAFQKQHPRRAGPCGGAVVGKNANVVMNYSTKSHRSSQGQVNGPEVNIRYFGGQVLLDSRDKRFHAHRQNA